MKKWSIGKKLWFLSGCLIANIVLQGAMGYYFSERIAGLVREIAGRELPAVRYMTLADMMHDGLRAVSYRALLAIGSTDNSEKEEIRAEVEEMSANFVEYLGMMQKLDLSEDRLAQITEVTPTTKAYGDIVAKIVSASLSGSRAQAEKHIPEFNKLFEELEDKLGKLGESIEAGAKETELHADKVVAFAKVLQIILMIAGALIGLGISFFIVRDLMKAIRNVMNGLAIQADNVNATSVDLESAAHSLSGATTEQAAALQETASAIEEMNAMVKKSAENASKSSEVAGASQEVAGKGKRTVEEMLTSINEISVSNGEIMRAVEHSNSQISEIVKVITEIGNKTKVINDIVFQTKLLSFNASVEAARAGEHGKGFAVVAEEVGNLAQMSGNAAKEISDMLTGSIQKVEKIVTDTKEQVSRLVAQGKSKVDSGSLVAKECAEILDEMVKNVGEVAEMITEISTAAAEQAQGVSEITKAMNQLDQTTHENAATSQQAAGSAAKLSGQATELLGVVESLKEIVDGHVDEESIGSSRSLRAEAPVREDEENNEARPEVKWQSFKMTKSPADEATPSRAKAVGAGELPAENDPRFQDL